MRTYVAITGVIFGLITVAHIWRIVAEGSRLAMEPFFILMTVASTAFALWAVRLLRSRTASS
jgi:hypothetical protein